MQIQSGNLFNYAVRINGVLPDIHTLGDEEISERAAEVKRLGLNANTSCSLFLIRDENKRSVEPSQSITCSSTIATIDTRNVYETQLFHLLIDVGHGVVNSLETVKNFADISLDNTPFNTTKPNSGAITSAGIVSTATSSPETSFESSEKPLYLPDALLITHAHDDHIQDLPLLLEKVRQSPGDAIFEIFCTAQCRDQIFAKFPDISRLTQDSYDSKIAFKVIEPSKSFDVRTISITPIEAYHGENCPPGSVVYILKIQDKTKIIIGWDFLSLKYTDESIFWSPDLAILGTQSFNQHPETGLISVNESFNLARTWNAKQCYLVHYKGLSDFKDAENQWFRGPAKPMTSDELQKMIDSYLKITGNDGKYKITVAREGMIWKPKHDRDIPSQEGLENQNQNQQATENSQNDDNSVLELEGLQKYILRIEKDSKSNMVYLMIEDKINRYDLRFVRPQKEFGDNHTSNTSNTSNTVDKEKCGLRADGEKGMLSKGPTLEMKINTVKLPYSNEEAFAVNIRAAKGKKDVFRDEIIVNRFDGIRLTRFINENF